MSQGQALILQLALAAATSVLTRVTNHRRSAAVAAVVALTGVLPPTFTGHAAGAGNHQQAVTSLAPHIVAASLWLGGLVAVLLVKPRRLIPDVATRFIRLALVCLLTVTISGVSNASIRLGSWAALWDSSYGWLVFGKLAALVLLGGIGWAPPPPHAAPLARWRAERVPSAGGR